MSQTPPPLPPKKPPTIEYHRPSPGEQAGIEFDTGGSHGVTGINLRRKDNICQLFAGVIGAIIGGLGGFVFASHSTWWTNVNSATFFGAVGGMLAGVFAWGLFLGIYYFGRRRKRRSTY